MYILEKMTKNPFIDPRKKLGKEQIKLKDSKKEKNNN